MTAYALYYFMIDAGRCVYNSGAPRLINAMRTLPNIECETRTNGLAIRGCLAEYLQLHTRHNIRWFTRAKGVTIQGDKHQFTRLYALPNIACATLADVLTIHGCLGYKCHCIRSIKSNAEHRLMG